MSASTRWLVAVAAVIGVAVVVSAVVAIVADEEQDFAAGTPEATVQRYLRAISDRDATEALALLSPSLDEQCRDFPREAITQRGNQRFRATLEETELRDGEALVRVSISERYGSGPFDGGESTWTHTFVLEQEEDGDWRFSEPPWPLYCARPLSMEATPLATAVIAERQ